MESESLSDEVDSLLALPYREDAESVFAVTFGEYRLEEFAVSAVDSFLRSRLEEYFGVLPLSASDRFLCEDLPSTPIDVKLLVEDDEYFGGVLFVSVVSSFEDPYLEDEGESVVDKFLLLI